MVPFHRDGTMAAMTVWDGSEQGVADSGCARCGAEMLSTGEILRGMCLRCLNSVNDPTCQTYSP